MSTPQEESKPSELRAQILEQHKVLRGELERIGELADALRADAPNAENDLVAALGEFREHFLKHLSTEEALVTPELAQTDSFAQERVKALHVTHDHQRKVVEELCQGTSGKSPGELLKQLDHFAKELLEDMATEETTHLSAKVLKDDLIPADYFGG